jgi:hypothetical protein
VFSNDAAGEAPPHQHTATATVPYSPPVAATFDDNLCNMTGRFSIIGILRVPSFAKYSEWVEKSSRNELLLYNSDGKQDGWINVWIKSSLSPSPNEMENLLQDANAQAEAKIHTSGNAIIGDDTLVLLTLHTIPSVEPAHYYKYPCNFVVEEVQLP